MAYKIKEIEDAIIAQIKNKITYLKTARSYQGDFEKDLNQIVILFPAMLVMFTKREVSPQLYSEDLTFSVIVADKSMRPDEARTGETGTYQMLEDLQENLLMETLDLNIEPIDFVREIALVNTKVISAYIADYKITQNAEDKIWKK